MRSVSSIVVPDTYRDSVFLMKLSSRAGGLDGIAMASAMMATPRNKDLFAASGLLTPEIRDARPDDLAVGLAGREEALAPALAAVRAMLQDQGRPGGAGPAYRPKSVSEAVKAVPGLNMALISVPGEYAAYEAFKALDQGLNVMIYSDNVSLADELRLKTLAAGRGLLLMGPDCGTALIGGVPLGFVNQVRRARRGGLGLVCASGTGAQQVMCLVDLLGGGISHCLGTGGRDLKDDIGALTTLQGLAMLDADPATAAIAVVGKPPGPGTRARLAEACRKLRTPVLVHYAGAAEYGPEAAAGIAVAHSLEEAAIACVLLLPDAGRTGATRDSCAALLDGLTPPPPPGPADPARKWLRGVYSGGTLGLEALAAAVRAFPGRTWSNLSLRGVQALPDARVSREHCVVDLGDDEFSVGRPHPMIDPTLRLERLHAELTAPDTAVVLLDLVIGHGAAPGQAAGIAAAIERAAVASGGASRDVRVIASVCGTAADVPSGPAEAEILGRAGVLVCPSNARAARLAVDIVKEIRA